MKNFILFLSVLLFLSGAVIAQNSAQKMPVAPVSQPAPVSPPPAAATAEGDKEESSFANSLLFTPLEILSIRNALKGGSTAEAVPVEQKNYNIPQVRRIIVSGIVYRNPEDWIVWINNKKMTPEDVLPEVVSVAVHEDKVDLEWYDIGLNDVIKIRMRPHQIYDIVTGVLLPG
jgi:hypothetical protein